jgi:hypothetical protein
MIAAITVVMKAARTKVLVKLGIFSAECFAGATWHGV